MNRPIVVLRPEPGARATVARIEALGRQAIAAPLFAVRALPWTPPDAADHDALVLTSANAARMAGAGLGRFSALPAFAVGAATAAAARDAGLRVEAIGAGTAAQLIEELDRRGLWRGLLLHGREHSLGAGGPISRAIAVYASDPVPIDRSRLAVAEGAVVLLHSGRAADRFAALVDHFGLARDAIRLAAMSEGVAAAAGDGWAAVTIALQPNDDALIGAATRLTD